VPGRFLIEESTPSTEASLPPDVWRLEVHSKARATGPAAAVGAAAVVGSAAAIWNESEEDEWTWWWSYESEGGGGSGGERVE
jgi:hypothetical protein